MLEEITVTLVPGECITADDAQYFTGFAAVGIGETGIWTIPFTQALYFTFAQFPEFIKPVDIPVLCVIITFGITLIIIQGHIHRMLLVEIVIHIESEIGAETLTPVRIPCIEEIRRVCINIIPDRITASPISVIPGTGIDINGQSILPVIETAIE